MAYNRDIKDNNLGDNVTINQVDVHYHHAPVPPQPRTPIQLIPYLQNKELVDRPDLVAKLDSLLPQVSTSFNEAALWGLGGSGKTQIALDYAYRRCENAQCSVFWVHADTKAAFIHDYKKIAALFGLEGILDGQELELLRAVSNRIQSESQWLLVLDNADDLSLFGVGETPQGSSNLFDFVPKGTAVGTGGTVLWTSRDGQIAGSLVRPSRQAIQVSNMTCLEARKLLSMARGKDSEDDDDNGNDEDEDIEKLLKELQWLPLGISQAGTYMRKANTTVREYLSLLSNNEERWPLLKEEQFDVYRKNGVPNSILKIWSISVARIEEENFMASELLRVMAYFDNQAIPHDMVDDAARYVSTTKVTSVEVKRAVMRLKEFSFIKLCKEENGSQSYEMHKIVQEAIRYAISALQPMYQGNNSTSKRSSTTCYARVAIQVVDNLFPNPPKEYEMRGGGRRGAQEMLDVLKRGERYFAHVIQVANWVEISNEEKTMCALLSRVSGYLRSHRRWKDKESVDAQILTLRMHIFGPNHIETIRSEKLMAENYCCQNRYSEAAEVEKRVFEKLRNALGEQDLYTIDSMNCRADILCRAFQFQEAEEIQAHAIRLLENIVDKPVGMLMVNSLYCLARAYYGQGKLNEVERVCIKTLTYCRDKVGGVGWHRYIAAATRIIDFRVQTLVVQGCLQSEAAASMEKLASEICERIERQTHLGEMSRMEMLVKMKAAVDKHLEVVEMQTKVVDFYGKTLGENHPKTISAMEYLAILYHSTCQYSEAETLQVKVVNFFQDAIGEEHPQTLDSMINLAMIYHSLDCADKSEEIKKKVLPLYSKILGRPVTVQFMRCNDNLPTRVLADVDDAYHIRHVIVQNLWPPEGPGRWDD
ncbi:hypothetical protein ACHAQJ_001237 [Trichoderma viride]